MKDIIIGRAAIKSVAITKAGSAMDLTGYAAELTFGDTTKPIKTFAGTLATNPATGIVIFALKATDTKTIPVGSYKYEVNIWKKSDIDIVYTPIEGNVKVRSAIDPDPVA